MAYGFGNQQINFNHMDVVKNIIEIRKQKGVNQEVIADVLNVDISTISKIEKGSRKLKVEELSKIAECLRVRVIDLFTYPKVFVDKESIEEADRISVTFEVSPDKRDYLLRLDRKSTRLNSSHVRISYAVFCLKKKRPDNEACEQ